jgi:hypothetical protein
MPWILWNCWDFFLSRRVLIFSPPFKKRCVFDLVAYPSLVDGDGTLCPHAKSILWWWNVARVFDMPWILWNWWKFFLMLECQREIKVSKAAHETIIRTHVATTRLIGSQRSTAIFSVRARGHIFLNHVANSCLPFFPRFMYEIQSLVSMLVVGPVFTESLDICIMCSSFNIPQEE